jgi:hypothetical protein
MECPIPQPGQEVNPTNWKKHNEVPLPSSIKNKAAMAPNHNKGAIHIFKPFILFIPFKIKWNFFPQHKKRGFLRSLRVVFKR